MRPEILKKKNRLFKFLRIYNFVLIILSLAYQSPFVGEFSVGKTETIDYVFEMIGFYKYDYGFWITARSALVEIIIFMLVSLQSYKFSSQEFALNGISRQSKLVPLCVSKRKKLPGKLHNYNISMSLKRRNANLTCRWRR
ncbi:hypothetical protein Ddye_016741 [Dipteronia dyeriana]|uniref:Uncharacterized protein n=1 Tax=Dipteronia dyeriana TaxID=168575 RepID=A0AAD9U7F7_9ROSI|nr:hypothetical protein Ddye_016741 [Dipteronia dyeriana]